MSSPFQRVGIRPRPDPPSSNGMRSTMGSMATIGSGLLIAKLIGRVDGVDRRPATFTPDRWREPSLRSMNRQRQRRPSTSSEVAAMNLSYNQSSGNAHVEARDPRPPEDRQHRHLVHGPVQAGAAQPVHPGCASAQSGRCADGRRSLHAALHPGARGSEPARACSRIAPIPSARPWKIARPAPSW